MMTTYYAATVNGTTVATDDDAAAVASWFVRGAELPYAIVNDIADDLRTGATIESQSPTGEILTVGPVR